MKLPSHFCLCLLMFLGGPLRAIDFAKLHVGDTAEADIITPVALDVVDATATAALQSARARQIPAVFRNYAAATNVVTRDFLAAFTQSRTNFLTELTDQFHSATMDEAAIASADFGRLVTGFGVKYKKLPIPDELAAEWARGGDGKVIQEKLLAALQSAANQRVCPDVLPDGMDVGKMIRLVPVKEANQKLSLEMVLQSPLAPAASLTSLASVQAQFRARFTTGQQLFARALAAMIQPNCLPDAPFSQLARGTAVSQMIVANHFDVGDTLVHRGDLIDAKLKAALIALDEKLRSGSPAPPVIAENPLTPPVAIPAPTPAPVATAEVAVSKPPPPAPAVKTSGQHGSLILLLAGISTGALLVVWWQIRSGKKRSASATATGRTTATDSINASVVPEVAQAVREAVLQELAQQRRELLLTHQSASEEIGLLVRRLDELQVPMQERLHTYESRIQLLERELAVRAEENREMLKLKIEMTRRQLETERAATSLTSSAA